MKTSGFTLPKCTVDDVSTPASLASSESAEGEGTVTVARPDAASVADIADVGGELAGTKVSSVTPQQSNAVPVAALDHPYQADSDSGPDDDDAYGGSDDFSSKNMQMLQHEVSPSISLVSKGRPSQAGAPIQRVRLEADEPILEINSRAGEYSVRDGGETIDGAEIDRSTGVDEMESVKEQHETIQSLDSCEAGASPEAESVAIQPVASAEHVETKEEGGAREEVHAESGEEGPSDFYESLPVDAVSMASTKAQDLPPTPSSSAVTNTLHNSDLVQPPVIGRAELNAEVEGTFEKVATTTHETEAEKSEDEDMQDVGVESEDISDVGEEVEPRDSLVKPQLRVSEASTKMDAVQLVEDIAKDPATARLLPQNSPSRKATLDYCSLYGIKSIEQIFSAHFRSPNPDGGVLAQLSEWVLNSEESQAVSLSPRCLRRLSHLPDSASRSERFFRVVQQRVEVKEIVTEAFSRVGGYREVAAGHPSSFRNNCWNMLWTWGKPKVNHNELLIWQRVNHLQNIKELTRKDLLKRNLSRFRNIPGRVGEMFDILPLTFVLPTEYVSFVNEYTRRAEIPGDRNFWIMKV